MDRAQPVQVRAVLAVLGFVPEFGWKRPYPERSVVHPVNATKFYAVFVCLIVCTDLSLCPGSGETHWPEGEGQWVAQGGRLPLLRGWCWGMEAGLRVCRQCQGQGGRHGVLVVAEGSC